LLVSSLSAAGAASESAANHVDLPKQVTYVEHVAPILNNNCVSCHQPGKIAPMSLLSYDEVRPWAKTIRKAIDDGVMPPWHADPGHGSFKNDRSLDPEEIALIDKWVKTGAKRGEGTAPEPPLAVAGWRLGEPDLIVTFDPVSLPAGGRDVFKDLVKKIDNDGDTWLRAVEVKPGNRKVVHHVILMASADGQQPQSGWLGAWAAGMDPMVFPEGTARLVADGASLIADMHYHPDAEAATDQTQIGLYFYDGEPEKELQNIWIQNAGFKIPAGAENHEVRASMTFEQDSTVLGLLPHMHYRGKDFTYTAHYPNGTSEVLLKVSDYDFNWQTLYELQEPKKMPAGSRIECVAHYDNSTNNPDNPDPTRDVTFGNESYDEMMIGFVDAVVDQGLRPMSLEERMHLRLTKMLEEHDEGVYLVKVFEVDENGVRGEDSSDSALYLPANGDGSWAVPSNGQMMEITVTEVVRDGNKFTAVLDSPFGKLTASGEWIPGASIEGEIVLPFDGNNPRFEGRPASKDDVKTRSEAP
jgi:mono/diheme cytochrome c family protein